MSWTLAALDADEPRRMGEDPDLAREVDGQPLSAMAEAGPPAGRPGPRGQ